MATSAAKPKQQRRAIGIVRVSRVGGRDLLDGDLGEPLALPTPSVEQAERPEYGRVNMRLRPIFAALAVGLSLQHQHLFNASGMYADDVLGKQRRRVGGRDLHAFG